MAHIKTKPESFNLKLDPELRRRAAKRAQVDSRTIASLIRHALKSYLDGTVTCEHCADEIKEDAKWRP